MVTYKKEIKYYEFDNYEQYQVFVNRYRKHESFKIKKCGRRGLRWVLYLIREVGEIA